MKMGDKTVQPNGEKLKLQIVTVTHWKNGCILEELFFWDNAIICSSSAFNRSDPEAPDVSSN